MFEEILQLLQTQDYAAAAALADKLTSEMLAQCLQAVEKTHLTAFCRALDSDTLADEHILFMFQDLIEIIDGAVPGSLRPDQ